MKPLGFTLIKKLLLFHARATADITRIHASLILTCMNSSRILLGDMNAEQNIQQATQAQNEVSLVLSKASEFIAKGDNRGARRLLSQAMKTAGPDDRDRLAALDRSLRMDIVAKFAIVVTAVALAIIAYISLFH